MYPILPLFSRGSRLFVGTADPTDTHALDEVKFHVNLAAESILVDEDKIRRCVKLWQDASDSFGDVMDETTGVDNLDIGGDDDDQAETRIIIGMRQFRERALDNARWSGPVTDHHARCLDCPQRCWTGKST